MAKKYLAVLGSFFLLIGVLGFFDVFKTGDKLFNVFAVDTPHNIIHIVTGLLAAFAMSRGEAVSRMFTQLVGVVYGVVTILGFVVGDGQVFGFIVVNQPDNVLHLVIAVTALYVGFGEEGTSRKTATA